MERDIKGIVIQGIVMNQDAQILRKVHLQLLKKIKKNKRYYYVPIQETITDENGKYSFQIDHKEKAQYKVLALDEAGQSEKNERR